MTLRQRARRERALARVEVLIEEYRSYGLRFEDKLARAETDAARLRLRLAERPTPAVAAGTEVTP